MGRRRSAAVAAMVAAVALTTAGPAEASIAATTATTTAAADGWVVENPDPNGDFEIHEGSSTIEGAAGGAPISCPLIGGWGLADSGTLRPNDFFGEVGVTSYDGCTGPGAADLQVFSGWGTVLVPETYDAASDRIGGSAYPWTWGMGLITPDCQVDLYPVDSEAPVPFTYDNATGTLDAGPFEVVATAAEGAGCGDLAAVGDELTFAYTVEATPPFTVRPV